GVTDVALIDEAVDSLAAGDGAALFGTVEKVMDAGHDPRRFAVDLLERLRDLILMKSVPDAAERGLVDAPGDVLERMRDEATRLGPATLTRYAEIVHAGLGEMRGATSPRLLVEVMCARMLLPAASDTETAVLQRLERLEQGIVAAPAGGVAPKPVSAPAAPAAPPISPDEPAARFQRPSQRRAVEAPPAAPPREATPPQPEAPAQQAPVHQTPAQQAPVQPEPAQPAPAPTQAPAAAQPPAVPEEPQPQSVPDEVVAQEVPPAVPEESAAPEPEPEPEPEPARAAGGPDAAQMRGVWSEVRAKVRERSRTVEVMLSGATVRSVDGTRVVLVHDSAPLAKRLADARNAT